MGEKLKNKLIEFKEMTQVNGTKLFILKLGESYGCFFEGRTKVYLMSSEDAAKIDGLCAYQEITGKTL